MFATLFPNHKPIIGVVHVGALPGTPACVQELDELVAQAVGEARLYRAGGLDAVMCENMHDVPYLRGDAVGPEIVAALTVIARAVKVECALPCGVQVLAGANTAALAVAHAAGLDFIRAEGYVFAHIADEGWIESSAAELLRYRRRIGAERISVWADVKKKHSSHAVTTDVSLGETAKAVEFMRGDTVIVTGATTGEPPRLADVQEVRASCRLPVVLGSGVNADNIADFYPAADGFIVGSFFKQDGHWANTVDPHRIESFMNAVRGQRRQSD